MLRILFLLVVLLALILATAQPVVPGVLTWSVGSCQLDWHTTRHAVVLACPGRDMLRLWPLPPVAPWFEPEPAEPIAPDCYQVTIARSAGSGVRSAHRW